MHNITYGKKQNHKSHTKTPSAIKKGKLYGPEQNITCRRLRKYLLRLTKISILLFV